MVFEKVGQREVPVEQPLGRNVEPLCVGTYGVVHGNAFQLGRFFENGQLQSSDEQRERGGVLSDSQEGWRLVLQADVHPLFRFVEPDVQCVRDDGAGSVNACGGPCVESKCREEQDDIFHRSRPRQWSIRW